MSGIVVSIIVTVYNKQKYIAQTLQSALDQTYRDIEVIAVNDGSTDGSLEVMQKFSAAEPRMKLLTQDNGGAAAALNRGLEIARGKFVNLLDGDDLLYPRFIDETVGYLERHPDFHLVHTSWDRIDEQGCKVGTSIAADSDDYLRDLLLGNRFAPSAMVFRKSLLDRVGPVLNMPVYDWEYLTRMAKLGAWFGRIPEPHAAYRLLSSRGAKIAKQGQRRFFEAIDVIFDDTLPQEYQQLKDVSIVRHRFYLMVDYLNWGLKQEAKKEFHTALSLLREKKIDLPEHVHRFRIFLPRFSVTQMVRFCLTLRRNHASRQALKALLWRLLASRLGSASYALVKRALGATHGAVRGSLVKTDAWVAHALRIGRHRDDTLNQSKTIDDIRRMALDFLATMRVTRAGRFVGYRHSGSTRKPVVYATLAALLLKQLYHVADEQTSEELELVRQSQSEDGLFRDPVIACEAAETEDWWGWRHLTLHALMVLGLYETPAQKELCYLEPFIDKDRFRDYLVSCNWGTRAAWTSNELQNLGVMLQYARDYQNSTTAGELMEMLFEAIDAHQDLQTGLYGDSFRTPEQLSLGVQAGYHFWLLYAYDNRPILHIERIIDSVLKTQNTLGGYGVQWNSSACEDIDSIDPLVRLSQQTDYRKEEIQTSLQRALRAILHNLNGDGGWVFRRHEALTVGHRQMFSAANESNAFYTWFRTLGLAYCLSGLKEVPAQLHYTWNFKRAPGYQFLSSKTVQ